MKIEVLLYGGLREKTGMESLTLELPSESYLFDLLVALLELYPDYGFKSPEDLMNEYSIYIGSKCANLKDKLNEKEALTIIPFLEGA